MRRLFLGCVCLAIALGGTASADTIVCDLVHYTLCSTDSGALFGATTISPAGTGIFDPFVRIWANGTEQGYNTDWSNPPLDAKQGTWTHSLKLGDLLPVTIGGIAYYDFRLDVNETKSEDGRYLSMDTVKIWLADSGDLHYTNIADFGQPVFDLDKINDWWVALDYAFNAGSGQGDLVALIPQSYFTGADPAKYVYFYSAFGGATGSGALAGLNFGSDDGFEEWAILQGGGAPPSEIPEPNTLLLIGGGLLLVAKLGRRRLAY